MEGYMEIGTKVKMIDCLEAKEYGDRVWVTRSEPWDLCGTMVVLLEGKRGGFSLEKLKIIE
jgi:hypothetical protein